MDRIKALGYKLAVFSLVIFVVYKVSMKNTRHDAR